MRILSRAELLQLPKGTIYCEVYNHDVGPLQRFDGVTGGDFLVSEVGPQFYDNGIDPQRPYDHMIISRSL